MIIVKEHQDLNTRCFSKTSCLVVMVQNVKLRGKAIGIRYLVTFYSASATFTDFYALYGSSVLRGMIFFSLMRMLNMFRNGT